MSSTHVPKSPFVRYGLSLAAVAGAVVLRWAFAPLIGYEVPFLFLWPVLLAAAWLGGFGPGLVVLVLGSLSVLPFLPPPGSPARPTDLFNLSVFVSFGGMLSFACARIQRELLRESDDARRLRDTLAGIVDAVIATDDRGRVTYMNPAAESLTGWPQSDAIGLPIGKVFRVYTEDKSGTGESPVPAVLATGASIPQSREVVIVTRDGTRREVERGAGPVPGPVPGPDEVGVDGCVIVFHDTTARRRAENAVKASEALFRRLVEASPFGVAITGADGSITEANDAFLQILGFSRAELEASDLWWDRLTPIEWREADELARAELDDRGVCEPYEKEFLTFDGRRVPVLVGAVLPDDQLVWSGTIVAYCVDLTEQKRAEANLRAADRRKDEFLAMLGHELRTPLAAVRNAVQGLALPHDDAQRGLIRGVLDRQTEHLSRVVDDLLDVSRLASGKIRLKPQPTELGETLTRAAEAARPLIDGRKHRLTLMPVGQPVWVSGDPVRLVQIFANLLNNAAKYTDEGGTITVEVAVPPDHVEVAIRDSGVGIPAELLSKVFDLFEQAGVSPDRSHGGLGLGLTLVRRLVEKHGGTVVARSDGPGTGSEFVVRLPTIPAPEGTPAPVHATNGRHAKPATRRVLVVDDNRDSANSLAMVLELLGHQVQAVNDGPAALDAVTGFRPDVVLLDIGMPGMTGFEVARRLRERPDSAGLRLVALTGYGQDEDRRRTSEAGFDAHLVKPASAETLLPVLA